MERRRDSDSDDERSSSTPNWSSNPMWNTNPLAKGASVGNARSMLGAQQKGGNLATKALRNDEKQPVPEERKQYWREQVKVDRTNLDKVEVVHNVEAIRKLLAVWPDLRSGERSELMQLKDELDPERDKDFRDALLNTIEQNDRQSIIAGEAGKLGGRELLGVVAGGQLQAVCIVKVLTGTAAKEQEVDANHWHAEWTRCLYISEFSSAPWNVHQVEGMLGFRGSGSALVRAAVALAKQRTCDGIGLVALASNVEFYEKQKFVAKSGSKAMLMDLRDKK